MPDATALLAVAMAPKMQSALMAANRLIIPVRERSHPFTRCASGVVGVGWASALEPFLCGFSMAECLRSAAMNLASQPELCAA